MNDDLMNLMLASLRRHGRHREYALADDVTKRRMMLLYEQAMARAGVAGCKTDELFHESLNRLRAAGLKVVRPPEIPKPELPHQIKDPVSGEHLKNLWAIPMPQDPLEQRKLISERKALIALSPALARHMQRMADDPAGYLLELKLAEEKRLRANSAEASYDGKMHAANPLCGDNETDKVEFIRMNRDRDPEWLAVCQREVAPVDLSPIFSTRHNAVRVAIWKAPTSERQIMLREIVTAAAKREAGILEEEFRATEREREEGAARAARDLAALKEKQAGVTRYSDGRIVTRPRG
jgi:hypothetical protein